jgi:hypothetical protein
MDSSLMGIEDWELFKKTREVFIRMKATFSMRDLQDYQSLNKQRGPILAGKALEYMEECGTDLCAVVAEPDVLPGLTACLQEQSVSYIAVHSKATCHDDWDAYMKKIRGATNLRSNDRERHGSLQQVDSQREENGAVNTPSDAKHSFRSLSGYAQNQTPTVPCVEGVQEDSEASAVEAFVGEMIHTSLSLTKSAGGNVHELANLWIERYKSAYEVLKAKGAIKRTYVLSRARGLRAIR